MNKIYNFKSSTKKNWINLQQNPKKKKNEINVHQNDKSRTKITDRIAK